LARSSHQYEENPEPEDEREGETSGYASDSGGTSNERNTGYWNQHRRESYQRHDNWMSDNQIHEKASGRFNKQAPWIPSNRYCYESINQSINQFIYIHNCYKIQLDMSVM
jgi:hypothetical protein